MMALRWINSLFRREPKRYSIYRKYCSAINSEERLKSNPYFDKYADKISQVQKISPEKFREILKEKPSASTKINQAKKNDQVNSLNNKRSVPKFQGQKALDQIMNLDAVKDKSATDIEQIWKQYHQSKDGLYAVLPKEAYVDMYTKLQEYPVFLFPLPRAEGYEFIMLQVQEHSCYFTSLINYQAYKENAPVSLTVNYFTELMDEKGIVLMQGEYDDKVLKVHEAQCLANQLQLYYGGKDATKDNLLRTFNRQPDSFRHMDLIANFENSLGK